MPKRLDAQTPKRLDATMAKSRNTSKPKRQSVKKTLHLDVLADGVLESLAVVRKRTNSEIICDLLLNEMHKLQGTEREAVRAVLTALGVEIPRRKNGAGDDGRGGQGSDEPGTPADGVLDRNSRLVEIGQSALAPVDESIEALAGEVIPRSSARTSRF